MNDLLLYLCVLHYSSQTPTSNEKPFKLIITTQVSIENLRET